MNTLRSVCWELCDSGPCGLGPSGAAPVSSRGRWVNEDSPVATTTARATQVSPESSFSSKVSPRGSTATTRTRSSSGTNSC